MFYLFVFFVRFNLLPDYLNRLSNENLEIIKSANGDKGLSSMMKEVTDVMDEMLDYLNKSSSLMNRVGTMTDDTANVRELVDKITTSEDEDDGPIYWMVSMFDLADKSSESSFVKHTNPSDRLYKDSSGTKYAAGAVCLTSTCLNNEIDYINTATISEQTSSAIPVPFSRVDLIALPMLWPILAVLVPFSIALCFSCTKNPTLDKLTHCLTCCGMICSVLQIPCMFIVAGFFWPLVLAGGDVCYGIENVMYQGVDGTSIKLCVDALGGFVDPTDPSSCIIATPGVGPSAPPQNISLNIPEVLIFLALSCIFLLSSISLFGRRMLRFSAVDAQKTQILFAKFWTQWTDNFQRFRGNSPSSPPTVLS